MIRAFQDRKTERVWYRERVKEFESIAAMALRRLTVLDSASQLTDLLICFVWREGNAYNVEITKHYR